MTFLVPALIFCLLIAPAIRLAGLASRHRQTPEIWAAAFFVGTAVGLPLRVLGHSILSEHPELAAELNRVGHVFFAFGSASMGVFTWRVFRPDSFRARWVCLAIVAAIATTTANLLLSGAESIEASVGMLLTNAARVAPMLWAFGESVRYWRIMKRRQAIGLADPVVTNRFGLWACWVGGLATLPTLVLLVRALTRAALWIGLHDGEDFSQSEPIVWLVRVVFGVTAPVSAVALSLSFFPPERYLRRVRERV